MNTGKLGCWTVSSCVVATSRECFHYSLILFCIGSDINKSSHYVSAERGSRRISTCVSTWISLHSCGLSWQPTAVPFPGTLGQAFHFQLARPADELYQSTPMASFYSKQPCFMLTQDWFICESFHSHLQSAQSWASPSNNPFSVNSRWWTMLVWYTASEMSWKFSSIHPGICCNILEFYFFTSVQTMYLLNRSQFSSRTTLNWPDWTRVIAASVCLGRSLSVLNLYLLSRLNN